MAWLVSLSFVFSTKAHFTKSENLESSGGLHLCSLKIKWNNNNLFKSGIQADSRKKWLDSYWRHAHFVTRLDWTRVTAWNDIDSSHNCWRLWYCHFADPDGPAVTWGHLVLGYSVIFEETIYDALNNTNVARSASEKNMLRECSCDGVVMFWQLWSHKRTNNVFTTLM